MKHLAILLILGFGFLEMASGQEVKETDALFLRKIYDKALTESACYDWLTVLSEEIGGRLAGCGSC